LYNLFGCNINFDPPFFQSIFILLKSSFEISAIINNDKLPLTINKMGKNKQIYLHLVKIWILELSQKRSKLMLQPNNLIFILEHFGWKCLYVHNFTLGFEMENNEKWRHKSGARFSCYEGD
jgi:uncharacterized membrane protein YukC